MHIEHQTLRLRRLSMHVASVGSGTPVVLLHGWPQTWHEWRKLMPLLAGHYRLIAPDLPGLGDSSKPADGYDKKTLAQDLVEMCEQLQLGRFHLVGHDWGGPTAFALACAAAASVRTLTILDVTIPGIGPDISQGGKRWHHAFHMTPDLPEALVIGREREYLSWFYESLQLAARRDHGGRHRRIPALLPPAGCAARGLRLLPQHPRRPSRQSGGIRCRFPSDDAGAGAGRGAHRSQRPR